MKRFCIGLLLVFFLSACADEPEAVTDDSFFRERYAAACVENISLRSELGMVRRSWRNADSLATEYRRLYEATVASISCRIVADTIRICPDTE